MERPDGAHVGVAVVRRHAQLERAGAAGGAGLAEGAVAPGAVVVVDGAWCPTCRNFAKRSAVRTSNNRF